MGGCCCVPVDAINDCSVAVVEVAVVPCVAIGVVGSPDDVAVLGETHNLEALVPVAVDEGGELAPAVLVVVALLWASGFKRRGCGDAWGCAMVVVVTIASRVREALVELGLVIVCISVGAIRRRGEEDVHTLSVVAAIDQEAIQCNTNSIQSLGSSVREFRC